MWWSVCICVYKTLWIMKNLFLLFHINLYISFASFVENSTLKKQIFHHTHALWTRDNFHGKFFFFSFIKIKWEKERERKGGRQNVNNIYTHESNYEWKLRYGFSFFLVASRLLIFCRLKVFFWKIIDLELYLKVHERSLKGF